MVNILQAYWIHWLMSQYRNKRVVMKYNNSSTSVLWEFSTVPGTDFDIISILFETQELKARYTLFCVLGRFQSFNMQLILSCRFICIWKVHWIIFSVIFIIKSMHNHCVCKSLFSLWHMEVINAIMVL